MLLSLHQWSVFSTVQSFCPNYSLHWSYTLLLKSPVLMHSWDYVHVACDHVLLSLLTHITASPHGNVRFHAHSMSAVAGSLHWCQLDSAPDSLWYSRGGSVEVARRKRKVDRFKISHVRICSSLVSRPHPGFISQPWRKIGRRPEIKTTSRTGNGGLG